MLEKDDFVAWANENVLVVVGHSEAAHAFDEVEEGGEKVKRCKLYPGLTCAQHEQVSRDAHAGEGGLPRIESKSGVPNSWLVSPSGEVREIDGADQQSPSKIIAASEAFQKEVGKHLTRKKYEALREDLAKGDAKAQEGAFKDALAAYGKVEKDLKKLPEGMASAVQERLDALDAKVREALDAIKAGDEDPAAKTKAARELERQVSTRLKSTGGFLPVKDEIAAYLKELKG